MPINVRQSAVVNLVPTEYNHDIFGIARDDSQELDQRVSQSVNDGSILTIALDNDFVSANTST